MIYGDRFCHSTIYNTLHSPRPAMDSRFTTKLANQYLILRPVGCRLNARSVPCIFSYSYMAAGINVNIKMDK